MNVATNVLTLQRTKGQVHMSQYTVGGISTIHIYIVRSYFVLVSLTPTTEPNTNNRTKQQQNQTPTTEPNTNNRTKHQQQNQTPTTEPNTNNRTKHQQQNQTTKQNKTRARIFTSIIVAGDFRRFRLCGI